jgi:hypothetical protein
LYDQTHKGSVKWFTIANFGVTAPRPFTNLQRPLGTTGRVRLSEASREETKKADGNADLIATLDIQE